MTLVWIVLKSLVFVLTHPKWTWGVYQGYRKYRSQGGSFADTDFYKFTMGQLYWRHFQHIGASYTLTIRQKVPLPKGFAAELRRKVEAYAANNHSISPELRDWLDQLPFMDSEFLDYLADTSRPKIKAKDVRIRRRRDTITIRIAGPVMRTSWWEVPIMHMFSETYFEMMGIKPQGLGWIVKAWKKGITLKQIVRTIFSEFGTRRRFSFFVQFMVLLLFIISGAKKGPNDKAGLIGTSNVFLAFLLGLTPIGTMAHELFMIAGAVYGYDKANKLIVQWWREEFGQSLGYILPDTYSTEEFLKQFDRDAALFFTGARQDSGDPIAFVDKLIEFYKSIGLRAKQIAQKTVIFSDDLNIEKAAKFVAYAWSHGIGAALGIGTFFSNDVGVKHLKIVIKPYEAWLLSNPKDKRGCVKISDDPAKITGEPVAVVQVLHWQKTGEITWTPLIAELPIAA